MPDRLNGASYFNFLTQDLNVWLLENVDLETRRQMIFQNDGAPSHYARNVRTYLNSQFREKWIGRGGPIAWPPRSPDLNPMDFFVWGYYKELVYSKESHTLQQLKRKLNEAEITLRDNRLAFIRLKDNFFRRCRLCIQQGGRHFENFL